MSRHRQKFRKQRLLRELQKNKKLQKSNDNNVLDLEKGLNEMGLFLLVRKCYNLLAK